MFVTRYRYVSRGYAIVVGILLCGCTFVVGEGARRRSEQGIDNAAILQSRMETFLAAFDSISAEEFVEFFPRTKDIVYRHTRHTRGGDEVVADTIRAAEIPKALEFSGKLWASFQFQFEGQPIGLLTQQVMMRTGRWHRVSESRFVPPAADSSSSTYVEWQMEASHWVISEVGDESFVGVPLPPWVTR